MSLPKDRASTRDELRDELQRQLRLAQDRGFCTRDEADQIRHKADIEYERMRPADGEREQRGAPERKPPARETQKGRTR